MIIPGLVALSSVPAGGVFLNADGNYYIKTDNTNATNLSTGAVNSGFTAGQQVTYFQGAQLLL